MTACIKKPPRLEKKIIPGDEDHPLFNPMELVIKTPMMGQIVKHLKEILFDYDSGACLLGGLRIGKTTALEEIVRILNQVSSIASLLPLPFR